MDSATDDSNVRVLLLPSWLDSGPGHWQSHWEARHDHRRVTQDDWVWPRRGDWMARLDEAVLDDEAPALLAAHSLGCQLVAAWAAHSRHTARVRGALLVAPPDTERDDMPPNLFNWRPIVRTRLPFASLAVVSGDDPFCGLERAAQMAADWGSTLLSIGASGHINGDSGLDDWPESPQRGACATAQRRRLIFRPSLHNFAGASFRPEGLTLLLQLAHRAPQRPAAVI